MSFEYNVTWPIAHVSMPPTAASVVEALYAVGYSLIEQDRYADAMHIFRTMLREAPSDERGWIALSICHERVGEDTKAERLLGLARQACPRSARTLLALGRLLGKIGKSTDSQVVFEQAEELARDIGDDDLASAAAHEGSLP